MSRCKHISMEAIAEYCNTQRLFPILPLRGNLNAKY